MFGRKSKLIAQLREQIASLMGQLAQCEQKAEGYKGIAEQALELARKEQFKEDEPLPKQVIRDFHSMTPEQQDRYQDALWRSHKPPEVKHCPECNVSVRSEDWPQECPACHVVFGFSEPA